MALIPNSNKTFRAILIKNVSIFVDWIDSFLDIAMPFISFGPWLVQGNLISSLDWKAFGIEFSENYTVQYISFGENIIDKDFFWADLYKYVGLIPDVSDYWTAYVRSTFIDDFQVQMSDLYTLYIKPSISTILNKEIFDRIISLNKETCGVFS